MADGHSYQKINCAGSNFDLSRGGLEGDELTRIYNSKTATTTMAKVEQSLALGTP